VKKFIFVWSLVWVISGNGSAQSESNATQHVIEGGKVVVELIKAFSGRKDADRAQDCKDAHADLCVVNHTESSLMVSVLHRFSHEVREMVVLPGGKECCLQAKVGVWTYELKMAGAVLPIRKGDLMIEGCNNMTMSIK
jgi:hypothetical protein